MPDPPPPHRTAREQWRALAPREKLRLALPIAFTLALCVVVAVGIVSGNKVITIVGIVALLVERLLTPLVFGMRRGAAARARIRERDEGDDS